MPKRTLRQQPQPQVLPELPTENVHVEITPAMVAEMKKEVRNILADTPSFSVNDIADLVQEFMEQSPVSRNIRIPMKVIREIVVQVKQS